MSKMDKTGTVTQGRASSAVTTKTLTKQQGAVVDHEVLSPQEEKVIRMVHGLSEADSTPLEFAVGASAETLAKLSMMEANNILALEGEVPLAQDNPARVQTALHALLTKLQG